MNNLKIKKIIDNILNNSIDEIREFREVKGNEWIECEKKYNDTYEKIRDILKEKDLDNLALDLESKMLNTEYHIANFYYKEGVRDALTKLHFLSELFNDVDRYI